MGPMLLTLRALAGSAHLGPTLAVTTITVVLASASELELWRVAVMGAMTLANQLSLGWSNDAIDAARDREAHRCDKPIVRGEVSARTVMTLAIGAALTAVGLSVLLGLALAVVHLVALAAGWLYNARLKSGLTATLCYMVGFGLIPLMVTLARADPRPAAVWAIAVGGMLGLAAHFANVLPDLCDDRRHRHGSAARSRGRDGGAPTDVTPAVSPHHARGARGRRHPDGSGTRHRGLAMLRVANTDR
jgi:4-hydroxybenzoate polyprenyltransferase